MAAPKTPVGRASFPAVFHPETFEGSDPKYAITLIFDEGTDLSELKAAAHAAARDKWGENIPRNLRSPFRDGAEKDLSGYGPGKTFVRFSSGARPAVVDQEVHLIEEESGRFYAGCLCKVSYSTYAYDKSGNRGVSFGLMNVQKVGDGEPFSSRTNPEDDFDEIEDQTPADVEDMFA